MISDTAASASRRVGVLTSHVAAQSADANSEDNAELMAEELELMNTIDVPLSPVLRGKIMYYDKYFNNLKDSTRSADGYDVAEHLPGPLQDVGPGKQYRTKQDVIIEVASATNAGFSHMKWVEMQDRYCGGKKVANFVLPFISFAYENQRPPVLTNLVILSHPEDCQRIARTHIRKMPDQMVFLGPGILSTTDNESWKNQRDHFAPPFLPLSSIAEVSKTSIARAEWANDKLAEEAAGGAVVNINEFLLHEAMAQLCIGLFGLPTDMVEENNRKIRDAFGAVLEATGGSGGGMRPMNEGLKSVGKSAGFLFGFLGEFLDFVETATEEGAKLGPLGARINDVSDDYEMRVFNAATFVFAGHDTTANTMTWLLFEVSQRPELQAQIHKEVDTLFATLKAENRCMEYKDMHSLPLLGRCLSETLRLWPVVPNGTFREMQFDDMVTGSDGKDVRLPKGTYVQITNWMRHRSPELWGDDAHKFNPWREWKENELWGENGEQIPFMAFNPSSDRYSPFTYPPRDCAGKNFSQMEMRVILAHLFVRFSFSLAPPSSNYDPETFMGVNRGTMGPRDLGIDQSKPADLAMHMFVKERKQD